ncbi:unnamed protein product [Calicophoron daubneyi]|uniref:Cleavage and polyadenylation specificity factor subunit 6 n=1 Tax=Calicophoron daubneyi TaxID=300641 RepID=A0AAV2TQK2_CALDB
MASDPATEIDLYDNIDEDFVQECTDLTELYDDVIAPTTSETAVSTSAAAIASKPTLSTAAPRTGRRVATYVGNLTWWTTDQDLLEAVYGLGINDVLEIKFHENRQNGQSKGFCVMIFGSDQSARIAMEKLPKTEIHGQNPVVTHCTKHNLSIFEKAAGCETQQPGRTRSEDAYTGKITGLSAGGLVNSLTTRGPPPLMATPTMPASLGFSLRNNTSLMGQAAPSVRQMNSSLATNLHQALASQNLHSGLSTGQLGQLPLSMPTVTSVFVPSVVPSTPLQANASGLLSNAFNLSNSLPTSLAGAPTHVNPSFLPQPVAVPGASLSGAVPTQAALMQLGSTGQSDIRQSHFDNYGRPVIHTYNPASSGKLSESEFEDILQRNKTVSSSAINRAVQDAASGDYASAIETLVTAISLIKQSKIANDDRCRILINSLQDTLHGIESKSYGVKNSSRRRRRSYSDSGSDGGMDSYNNPVSGGSSSRRRRDRGDRSRSRERRDHHDRHDRHRHSRDRNSGTSATYYGVQSGAQLQGSSSIPTGVSLPGLISSGQGTCATNSSSGSDRYRYRH